MSEPRLQTNLTTFTDFQVKIRSEAVDKLSGQLGPLPCEFCVCLSEQTNMLIYQQLQDGTQSQASSLHELGDE